MNLVKIKDITPEQIASICDHTFLFRSEQYFKKDCVQEKSAMQLRQEDFLKFVNETLEFPLTPYALCVRPEDVLHTKRLLDIGGKPEIKIASVVGFPDGAWYPTAFKVAETEIAINHGASEIDMVLDYNRHRHEAKSSVMNDIEGVTEVAHKKGALVKLILETSELCPGGIVNACKYATECGVDFVKTSTGFGKYGAKPGDFYLMEGNFKGGLKAAGGIKTREQVIKLLNVAARVPDGFIDLDPLKIRIGESSLLKSLVE